MSRERVYVVDDDPAMVEAVVAVLSLEGYRVEGTSDSEEALREVLKAPPDLLVLDVNMPGLNGWELCDIVRRQKATRGVPVLFLTGRAEMLDQITALQVGGSDHLKKPFRADDLRGKVRALTSRAKPARKR